MDEIETGFSIEKESFDNNNGGLLAEQIQALDSLVFHLQFKMVYRGTVVLLLLLRNS